MTERDKTIEQIRAATELLEAVAGDRSLLYALSEEERIRLLNAAGDVFCPDIDQRRQQARARRRRQRDDEVGHDEALLAQTGIRRLRAKPVFTTPNALPPPAFAPRTLPEAREPQHCYVCKQKYSTLHHFYDQLCPRCAELNHAKRTETADLRSRVALLTGGRVKIGYQAAIKLLRAGTRLLVTTRFPRDAALRYAREADFDDWADRLEIFGLDLRHTPSVEAFCRHLDATEGRLDFIINNACQTVSRPPDFYRHMMALETASWDRTPPAVRAVVGDYEGRRHYRPLAFEPVATLGSGVEVAPASTFPEVLLDQDPVDQNLQQIDRRTHNSWRMRLADVPVMEMLETQLVNAVAPFVLNARLKSLMLRAGDRDKHVVNVSAVEGQFYRRWKTTRHPHTNMAKAALNMMTRTCAADYHADGIHMNSVDTGWVTDEDPAHLAERKVVEQRFHPPLDILDGAARVVDPIISGFNTGHHLWGQFLKDYHPTDW